MIDFICPYEIPWTRRRAPQQMEEAAKRIKVAAEELGITEDKLSMSLRLLHTSGLARNEPVRTTDDGQILCPRCGGVMHPLEVVEPNA